MSGRAAAGLLQSGSYCDKDCVEDLRFYPRLQYVDVINRALSVKGGSAKLLHVYVDVEPVTFNRGFFTVDMRFFYQVTLQAYLSTPAPVTVEGLCVFDKRVLLFGSEGSAKIFSSEFRAGEPDAQCLRQSNLPVAVVEAVDPIVLDAKLVESCGCRPCDCDLCEVPSFVSGFFGGERVLRAPDDGIFHQLADIGTRVQAGDVVGEVNGKPMACTIAGVIRGMLADGTPVYKGMKSGDVDPRGELSYCYTASDKAIAIGGGVLQAILEYTGVLSNVTGQNAWEV